MNRMSCLAGLILSMATTGAIASPAEAGRIEKSFQLSMEKWALEVRIAATPEARAKVWSTRPDPAVSAKQMWQLIGLSLKEDWTIAPAAWFLRITSGLPASGGNGTIGSPFASETTAIRAAVEANHIASPKLTPMCLALVSIPDPRSLSILEKIQTGNPESKIQGVAALGAALVLKNFGEEPELMRKRLTYLRKSIIQSADVEFSGISVAKLAEDELYLIRFLSKGRVAPDLSGVDSAGRPLKLSDHRGKVIVLMFWNNEISEAARVIQITAAMQVKFRGKPFVIIGVNNDPLEKLRAMQADNTVPWQNFTDPENKLSNEFRVGSRPLVYVLDGERKIHYAGSPGSFVELTADALVSEIKSAAE